MSSSFTVVANIGRDAEIRYTPSNKAVCEVVAAYSYGRDKKTQWISAVLWDKFAESLAPYLVKGQQVVLFLSDVHIEDYTTREGAVKSKLVGQVKDIKLVGSKPEGQSQPKQQPQSKKPADNSQGFGGDPDFGDDIPFAPYEKNFY